MRKKFDFSRLIVYFSDLMVAVLILIWIAGSVYGCIIVWQDHNQFCYLMEYISKPMELGLALFLVRCAGTHIANVWKNGTTLDPDIVPRDMKLETFDKDDETDDYV